MENATHTRGVPAATPRQIAEANATSPLPKSDADYAAETSALVDWLERNGVPPDAVVALPPLPHAQMSGVLRHCDAALFPNRCEGGTNLVAMEAVAAGIPTVVANATGQADLVAFLRGADGCWPVPAREKANGPPDAAGREPDVEAVAQALEAIYSDPGAARRRALDGARRMRKWDWAAAVGAIVEATASS